MSDVIVLEDGTTLPNTAKGHIELEAMVLARGGDHVVPSSSFRDALLEVGREFEGGSLPPSFKRMTPRMCFANAFILASGHAGLRYCEGYAMRRDLPLLVHHAWVIDDENKVIEPTWDLRPDDSYFGIVFELEDVCQIVLETERYSLFFTRQGNKLIEEMGER